MMKKLNEIKCIGDVSDLPLHMQHINDNLITGDISKLPEYIVKNKLIYFNNAQASQRDEETTTNNTSIAVN